MGNRKNKSTQYEKEINPDISVMNGAPNEPRAAVRRSEVVEQHQTRSYATQACQRPNFIHKTGSEVRAF
jgi:hypothetical protein